MAVRTTHLNLLRFVGVVFLVFIQWHPARAQSVGIRAAVNRAQQKPGKILSFTLGAISPAKITRVELIYGVSSNSCPLPSMRGKPAIQAGLQVNARYEWSLAVDDAYLPGIEIWWQWEIHDEAGNMLLTEPQTLVVEDPDYQWQMLENGPIRLYWTEGGLDFGKRLIDKASRSMDRLAKNAGIQPTGDLSIVIYPSVADLLDAVTGVADWTGGVTYSKFDVVLIGISENDPHLWADQVIPHELAHLLTSMHYSSCLGDPLPLWLAEGLAEYAEGKMPKAQRDLLLNALGENQVPDLTTLSSTFPAEQKQAQLAYAHSRAVVEYLLDNEGMQKMNTLLGNLRDGEAVDLALRSLYGFDTAGLDQAWRAAEGFGSPPELYFSTHTPTPTITLTRTPTPIPPTQTPRPSPTWTDPPPSPTPTQTTPIQDNSDFMGLLMPVGVFLLLVSGASILLARSMRGAKKQ